MPKNPLPLEEDFEKLEQKFNEAVQELRSLRSRVKRSTFETVSTIRHEWEEVDHKWFVILLAGAFLFFIFSFFFYSMAGQYLDHRPLPQGSDILLNRLPLIDLTPVLSYGWLATHLFATAAALTYCPRRIPYLLGTIGLFMIIRTVFVALNPVGAPSGMINLNAAYLFAPIRGILAFENEFFFSGHTSLPYLYFLIFQAPWIRGAFLLDSFVMAASVLLTRNHYTIDVLGAYFMTYAIYRLSRRMLGWLDPYREVFHGR